MRLRILGCSGSSAPGQYSPAFLVDGELLLDAGTIGAVLSENEQVAIRTVLITHAHLDHVKGLAHLADNLLLAGSGHAVQVVGTEATLGAMAEHLFNDRIWPDFTRIPAPGRGVLRWHPIVPEQELVFEGYRVTAVPVDHTVPAVGYRVSRQGASLLYTGDTGPTRRIWKYGDGISALIVEVSFANGMEDLCRSIGHLTPALLVDELGKLPEIPPRVLAMHLKPHYTEQISAELSALGITELEVLCEGAVYDLAAT